MITKGKAWTTRINKNKSQMGNVPYHSLVGSTSADPPIMYPPGPNNRLLMNAIGATRN